MLDRLFRRASNGECVVSARRPTSGRIDNTRPDHAVATCQGGFQKTRSGRCSLGVQRYRLTYRDKVMRMPLPCAIGERGKATKDPHEESRCPIPMCHPCSATLPDSCRPSFKAGRGVCSCRMRYACIVYSVARIYRRNCIFSSYAAWRLYGRNAGGSRTGGRDVTLRHSSLGRSHTHKRV